MQEILDRSRTTTCAKGTLLGLTRTGCLVMGAVLASILLIDLPLPAGRAADAPPYVPASDTWIEPGAALQTEPSLKAPSGAPALAAGR